jgi:ribosomal protein L44E
MPEFPSDLFFRCSVCHSQHQILLADDGGRRFPLACPTCRKHTRAVSVRRWKDWIEEQVRCKRKLPSRKQAARQSDPDISFTGVAGELAACLLVCPGYVQAWRRREEEGGNNRGCDLPKEWTGLDKDIEVKEQPYQEDHRGLLIIRPRDTGSSEVSCFASPAKPPHGLPRRSDRTPDR